MHFYTHWQSLKSHITMSLDKLINLIHLNNVISNVLVVLFIGNTNLDDKRISKAIDYKSITIRLLLSCSTGAWPIRRGFDRICIQWVFFKSNLINQIKKIPLLLPVYIISEQNTQPTKSNWTPEILHSVVIHILVSSPDQLHNTLARSRLILGLHTGACTQPMRDIATR